MADFIPFLLGILGLAAAYHVFRVVLQYPPGTGRVVEIAEEIHKRQEIEYAQGGGRRRHCRRSVQGHVGTLINVMAIVSLVIAPLL